MGSHLALLLHYIDVDAVSFRASFCVCRHDGAPHEFFVRAHDTFWLL